MCWQYQPFWIVSKKSKKNLSKTNWQSKMADIVNIYNGHAKVEHMSLTKFKNNGYFFRTHLVCYCLETTFTVKMYWIIVLPVMLRSPNHFSRLCYYDHCWNYPPRRDLWHKDEMKSICLYVHVFESSIISVISKSYFFLYLANNIDKIRFNR